MWTTYLVVYKFRLFSSNSIDFLAILNYYSDMKRLIIKILSVIFIGAVIGAFVYFLFNVDLDSSKKTKKGIYATGITIDCFRSLTLYVGNYLQFNDAPYTIIPSDYNLGVDIKILNHIGEEKSGASFENNCFKATETGLFYLKFEVKTAYNTVKYDKIKITVTADPSECESVSFTQESKTITVNEILDLNEFLVVSNMVGGEIYYKASDGEIKETIYAPPGNIGKYFVEVGINKGDYSIVGKFNVTVSSVTNIGIRLYGLNNVLIKDGQTVKINLNQKILEFSYIIDGLIYQLVRVEIENSEIVSLQSSDAPIIVFDLHKVGQTKVIIRIPNRDYKFTFFVNVESA